MAQIHCNRPPLGWKCKRPAPHIGPCAAEPTWWNRIVYKVTGRSV